MKNVWNQNGNRFSLQEVTQQIPKLEPGIYKFGLDMYEQPFLAHVQNEFQFPYKVYGVERPFIDRVKKSYAETNGNFGVILNGTKGTGKTVTAEIICNELSLPVIIVSFHHKSLVSFLNDIQQEVIIFIDEFEKIYDGYENSLLSIMDGALKTEHRLFFLLTTNEMRVDRNLLQRPSRIRYVKTFSDMTLPIIMEVVNDRLTRPEWREETIKAISELPIITMDLVKSLIEEVNIHNEHPEDFKDVFNTHSDRTELFNVYEIIDGEKNLIDSYINVTPSWIMPTSVGEEFNIARSYRGRIISVQSDNQITVENNEWNEEGECVGTKQTTYYLEKTAKTHYAFNSYVI